MERIKKKKKETTGAINNKTEKYIIQTYTRFDDQIFA